MSLHWEKISECVEFLSHESLTVFLIPQFGRVYVTQKDKMQAQALGGNPLCYLRVALTGCDNRIPLLLITQMQPE